MDKDPGALPGTEERGTFLALVGWPYLQNSHMPLLAQTRLHCHFKQQDWSFDRQLLSVADAHLEIQHNPRRRYQRPERRMMKDCPQAKRFLTETAGSWTAFYVVAQLIRLCNWDQLSFIVTGRAPAPLFLQDTGGFVDQIGLPSSLPPRSDDGELENLQRRAIGLHLQYPMATETRDRSASPIADNPLHAGRWHLLFSSLRQPALLENSASDVGKRLDESRGSTAFDGQSLARHTRNRSDDGPDGTPRGACIRNGSAVWSGQMEVDDYVVYGGAVN
ncbi:hypothetical protein BDK51DRAFT_44167 [Blyttiomyces helicus]|uniref:Uncharacterized protein n=1 Tax=Blyttiomyces helicus TaxID=388810 RepID=A0A4P9WLP3_9FUNG|nr:hypothetical protein BDK51DRAFT_44167 [Blyttiomyces helicus]|eukprot:RKO93003.1 hypothetical protein BDK51DRAFT_44167 [Blyttiomyces helicus]